MFFVSKYKYKNHFTLEGKDWWALHLVIAIVLCNAIGTFFLLEVTIMSECQCEAMCASPQVDSWSKIWILIRFLWTKYNFIQAPFFIIWLLNAFETKGYLIHYVFFCWFCVITCFSVYNYLCLSFNVMLFVLLHLFFCVFWIMKRKTLKSLARSTTKSKPNMLSYYFSNRCEPYWHILAW